MADDKANERDELGAQTAITLQASALTLLGVILSIAISLALGLPGPWWFRVGTGALVAIVLITGIKILSGSRRGPLTRIANWVLGAPNP